MTDPGIVHTMVDPNYAKKITIHHEQYLKYVKIIKADVLAVTEKEIILSDGSKEEYEFLVIGNIAF
jgi:hypothetical protein